MSGKETNQWVWLHNPIDHTRGNLFYRHAESLYIRFPNIIGIEWYSNHGGNTYFETQETAYRRIWQPANPFLEYSLSADPSYSL